MSLVLDQFIASTKSSHEKLRRKLNGGCIYCCLSDIVVSSSRSVVNEDFRSADSDEFCGLLDDEEDT